MISMTLQSFRPGAATGDRYVSRHAMEVHCPQCGRWHLLEKRPPAAGKGDRSGSLFWLCGRLWYFAGHVGADSHLHVRSASAQ